MKISKLSDITSIRSFVTKQTAAAKKIAFVPTMGALHEGHLSLVKEARQRADVVVVSIFVNPKQFAENEDLDTYPRTESADIAKLEALEVDAVYVPQVAEIYPEPFHTSLDVGVLGTILEGEVRPHFFNGVAIVVTKLLLQVLPDVAVFGEKDYQQLLIVKQLVKELDIPSQIIGAPTVREADGLAMSSRNVYLKDKARGVAPVLYQALLEAKVAVDTGEPIADIEKATILQLLDAGFEGVDYVAIRNAETLEPVNNLDNAGVSLRILAAVQLAGVRLIDNIVVV